MNRPSMHGRAVRGAFLALVVVAMVVGGALWAGRGTSRADDDAAVVRRAADPAEVEWSASADGLVGPSGEGRSGRVGRAVDPSLVGMVPHAATRSGPPAPQMIGVVVDASGDPVVGAAVLASTRWSRTSLGLDVDPEATRDVCKAETDTLGAFLVPFDEDIPLLRPGRRGTVLVRARGCAPELVTTEAVPEQPPLDLGTLTLVRGAVASGRVLGPDGQPLDGARVFFGQTETRGAFRVRTPTRGFEIDATDAEGRFRCDELREGPFHVLVDAPGLPLGYVESEARLDAPAEGLVVRLERGAAIRGRVVGADDATTLEIRAWLDDEEERSAIARRPRRVRPDADGAYTIDGLLPAREYELSLTGPTTGRSRSRAATVRAVAGETDVELVWNTRATVTARIVAADAASLESVPVTRYIAWSKEGVAKEDDFDGRVVTQDGETKLEHPGGRFVLPDLAIRAGETRTYTFRFRATGFADKVVRGVSVPAGETVDLGDVVLDRGEVIRVRAVTEGGKEPVESARVFLASASGDKWFDRWRLRDDPAWSSDSIRFGETDDEGLAVLQVPPGGPPYRVAVNADAFPLGEPVEIPRSGEETVVELQTGAALEADVVDDEGTPQPGVTVTLTSVVERGRRGARQRTLKTDDAGRVVFEHVERGAATLYASPPAMRPRRPRGWADSRANLDVPGEGVVRATLVVPRAVPVIGRVIEAGAPLTDARIRFAVREGREVLSPEVTSAQLRAITGIDGAFALEAVPVGRYEVSVVHADRAMPTNVVVDVAPEMPALDIRLEEAAVEGRVVLAGTGDAVAFASVEVLGPDETHTAYVGERTRVERPDGSLDERDDWARPGRATTGRDGAFAFRGLGVEVPVRVRVRGTYLREQTIALGRLGVGEVRRDVVLEVQAAAALRVDLERANSGSRRRNRVGVRVWRLDRSGEPRGRPTQRFGGRFVRLTGLPVGSVRVETVRYGREGNEVLESRDVELVALEELRLRMRGE